jgi:MoaA/NifB/PqqE/SkfB family radical SAM enzyme
MDKSQSPQKILSKKNDNLDMLIFFVTGRCNAACQHCFYWQNLGADHAGLSLEHIERIAKSAPNFRTLLLSGGEPTLRSDLPQLVSIFKSNNQIRNVSVPTNGLLPDRITKIATEIVTLDPKLNVSFNLSIDGFAEIHDEIRNVKGNYEKAMQSLEKLAQLSRQQSNFRVLINTVICADNYDQVVPFARHIESSGLADGHFFEIVRGEPPENRVKSVPAKTLREIYQQLLPIQAGYLAREARHRRRGLAQPLHEILDIGNLINKYHYQWGRYAQGRKWDFPCTAGEDIGVIDYDGRLRICELRLDSVALADYDYNFTQAWQSITIRREATFAKTHSCDCTHTCFIGVSMRKDIKYQLLSAPWRYMLYKMGRVW